MEALQILVKNMETKQDIRKRVLKQRIAMPKEEWQEKSRMISEKVISHPAFCSAEEIFCYVSCRSEADTYAILREAWRQGKKTAVPKVHGKEMDFYYIQSFDELEEGCFKIPEPVTAKKAEGKNVLVIVPGAAFDRRRNRIGYGKGFYDRYLEKHSECRTLAIAFGFQIVERIPASEHDVLPEILITEECTYA